MNDLILITGATGFLGGAVAVDAIQRGLGPRLLLLVRADDAPQGLARLTANLRLLGASDEQLRQLDRAQVLLGELNELRQVADDARLERVGVVIHCAALATFAPHPALKSVNVDGTLALASLMHQRPRLRRFVYIGTAMACGKNVCADEGVPEETRISMAEQDHLVPYTRSKAMAERLLQESFPDLPLVILRPSIIVGHSTLGCAPSQSIFWVFQAWHRLGVLTANMDDHIDVVPVDWCASAILTLALKERLAQTVFHLSAGPRSSQSFRQIGSAMERAGLRTWTHQQQAAQPGGGIESKRIEYTRIAVSEIDRLLPDIRHAMPDCNPRLLTRALKLYGEFARLSYIFHNRGLLSEGIRVSPRLTDYIGTCIDSTRHIGIASQMKWDFK